MEFVLNMPLIIMVLYHIANSNPMSQHVICLLFQKLRGPSINGRVQDRSLHACNNILKVTDSSNTTVNQGIS